MKRNFLLSLLLALFCMAFSIGAYAQAILVEDFNYTVGSTLISNGWSITGSSQDNPILVGDGLAFSGYAGSGIGGAALVNNNYQDVNKSFTSTSSGTLYMAFMFKTGSTNSQGYFMHMSDADTNGNCSTNRFSSRIWVNGQGTQIGISNNSSFPTGNTLTITPGTTYLGVVEHDFTSGSSKLYVFENFPSSQPTSGFVTASTTTTYATAFVCLRQYNNNQDITVDGIRVATTWSDAVAAASTNMADAPTFSPAGGLVTTPSTSVTLSCTTPGASIYYTLDGSTPDNTATLYSSPITLTQTTTIKAIAYATGYTASPVVSSTYTFITPVANIADFKTAGAADNTQVYRITGNVVVTAQKGNNNLYLQDATGGLLLYQQSGGLNFQPGDVFQGTLIGTYTTYQNQPEFLPQGTLTAVPGGTVTPVAATISQIKSNFNLYANNLVTLTDVVIPQGTTYTSGNAGTNIIFVQNGDTMTLYNNFRTLDMTIANGMVANITGIASLFNSTYELSPRFNADIVEGTPQPSITILQPTEGAVYRTVDTLPVSFDIQNFNVGTDGLVKIESYMLTQLNLPNPLFLDNAMLTLLQTQGITPPLPANWMHVVVSLVGLDSLPLTPAVSDTVNFSTYMPQVPAPTFVTPSGTYPDSVVVSITCYNPDATIRYTLDGTEPTETSTIYTAPFTLTSNTTVTAKAFLTNWRASEPITATYTIAHEPALAVSVDTLMMYNIGSVMTYFFDVTSAFITSPIQITCDNPCFHFYPDSIPVGTNYANIQITYNCSNYPGLGTLTVTGDTLTRQIELIAITNLPEPTFTPATGASDTLINVTLACSEPSATIFYTLDGSNYQAYTAPIVLNTTGTYTVSAYADGGLWLPSNTVTATYTVTAPVPPTPPTPVFNDTLAYYTGFERAEGFTPSTNYQNASEVFSGTAGHQWATVYGTPSKTSPICDSASMQLRWYSGAPTTFGYTRTDFDVAHATRIQFLAKSSNGLNVLVSYSTDGGNTYTDSLFHLTDNAHTYNWVISENAQYNTVRFKFTVVLPATTPGGTSRVYIDSVSIFNFPSIVSDEVAMPVISPNGGTIYEPTQVSITCATPDATIYYTLDGSDPTQNSTQYTAPFTVSASTTVKAKAFKTGFEPSNVATAIYTFPIEVNNIAAFKAANSATNATVYKITGDVTFVYAHEANFYIQDATGGLLIYDNTNNITGTYVEGDVISGGICGTYTLYNGLVEMKPTRDIAASTSNTGTVTPVIADVATIANQYDNFESRLVKLEQVTFTEGGTFTNGSATNLAIEQNGSSMIVRSVFKNLNMAINAGQVADVTGFVLRFNSDIQIAPRANSDIVFSTVGQDTVALPVITVNPLTNGMHTVSITCATPDAEIHYTTDGSTPTATSAPYIESFIVGGGTTIKAIAMKEGMVSSEVAIYTVSGIQNYDNVIELYPNPTSDRCVVRSNDNMESVSVYNVFGQLMETVAVQGNQVEINLGQYAAGTYFLRIVSESGIATRTVVRK